MYQYISISIVFYSFSIAKPILIDMRYEKLLLTDENGQRYRIVREDTLSALTAGPLLPKTEQSIWDTLVTLEGEKFGQIFRSERERLQIDVSEIAEKSGLKEPNIRNIELGNRGPRPKTRRRMVAALRLAHEAA